MKQIFTFASFQVASLVENQSSLSMGKANGAAHY